MSSQRKGSTAEGPSQELVLAALARAIRHRGDGAHTAAVWSVFEHLDVPRRSAEARRVRARLRELCSLRLIVAVRSHGVEAWELTPAGQRRLAFVTSTAAEQLPESPQHREWKRAKTAATQEIERFKGAFEELLEDATRMLAAREPQPSDEWFALAETLRQACRLIGSASHCLYEWREPREELADVDTRIDDGDGGLSQAQLDARRALRMGRRNIRLWRYRA